MKIADALPPTMQLNLLRAVLTAAALVVLVPLAAWLIRPAAFLLPLDTPGGGFTGGESLAVVTRHPALPGDILYLAAQAVTIMCALTAVALALAVLWRGTPTRQSRHLMAFLLGGAAYVVLSYLVLPAGRPAAYARILTAAGPLAAALTAGLGALAVTALVKFSVVFPAPLRYDDVAARVAFRRPSDRRMFRAALTFAHSPWSWVVLVGGTALTALISAISASMIIIQLAMLGLVAAYLFLKLGRAVASLEDARRIGVIFVGLHAALWAGTIIGIVPFALGPLTGDLGYSIYITALIGFGPGVVGLCLILSLAAAVLVRGALDPDVALRRTTIYGLLGVLYVAVYGVIENLLFGFLEDRLGLSNVASAVLLGAPLAVFMVPLHRWLAPVVEGRLQSVSDAVTLPDGPGSN
jgi:hypothetical protein